MAAVQRSSKHARVLSGRLAAVLLVATVATVGPAGTAEADCPVTDTPDLSFVDFNCDGIDGDVAGAIFVSTVGNDAAVGTIDEPKRTLTGAMNAAFPSGKDIYVATGTYNEPGGLILQNGVGIYGGYDPTDWTRSLSNITSITGSPQAAIASGVSGITLQHLRLTGANNGASAYGVRAVNAQIVLERVNAIAGPGAGGIGGGPGTAGANGNVGLNGAPGSCDGSHGVGGTGGTSAAGRTGGAGGRGGLEGSNAGVAGSLGVGGTAGGAGGAGGNPGSPGGNGANGAAGVAGPPGVGGSNSTAAAGPVWVGISGTAGGAGTHGNGGGGGGGGGGQGGTFVNNGGGNGAGGGGAGGAAGGGGSGGTAGHGSFGVYGFDSQISLRLGTTAAAGPGGNGGAGGAGGTRGAGALGGTGASVCTGEVGRGGNGGRGGDGGQGGAGGGGAGGPSIAVAAFGTSSVARDCDFITSSGAPGFGGGGSGVPGSAGISAGIFPSLTNDAFARAATISGVSGTLCGSNSGATKQPGEPNHAGGTGGASVWYRWTAPLDGRVSFNTGGSGFSTLLAAYSGTNLGALTELDSNTSGGEVTWIAVRGVQYMIALDGAAGASGTYRLNWRGDVTAPVAFIDSAPETITSLTDATFTFHADEPAILECSLDGSEFESCDSPLALTDLADGTHSFRVRATDEAGNTGVPASHTWTVDTVAPDTIIDAGPPALTNTPDAVLDFHATEPATFDCRLDGQPVDPCIAPVSLPGLPDGEHMFNVFATDLAGNADATPAEYTWTIDTVAPDTIIDAAPPELTASNDATFEFHSTESGGEFVCSLNEAPLEPCVSPTTHTVPTGVYHYRVVAIDEAGNVDATPAEWHWTVDNIAPDAPVFTSPASNGKVAGPTVQVKGTAEPGSTLRLKEGSSTLAIIAVPPSGLWTSSRSYSDGSHTLTATATDAVGNVSPVSSLTFIADASAPVVQITRPVGGVYVLDTEVPLAGPLSASAGSVTVKARATDAHSGICAFRFEVDNEVVPASEVSFDPVNNIYSFEYTPDSVGSHTIVARGENCVGMATSPSVQIVTVPGA